MLLPGHGLGLGLGFGGPGIIICAGSRAVRGSEQWAGAPPPPRLGLISGDRWRGI